MGTETVEDVVMRRRSKTWRLVGTETAKDAVMRRRSNMCNSDQLGKQKAHATLNPEP